MYGKLFSSMYDGSLVESWQALVTFQQMIVLCDADGVLDMTPEAIARRTGIPIEIIKAGIEILEKPDTRSRTPDEDGKRIIRLDAHRDWGWFLVNHEKYKSMQDSDTVRVQNRERKRRQRERERASRSVTDGHSQSRHTDTDTDKEKPFIARGDGYSAEFSSFWSAYPRKVGKKGAWAKWKTNVRQAKQVLPLILAALEWQRQLPDWTKEGGKYIPHPERYISKGRWLDEKPDSCTSEPEYRRKIRQQKSLEDACN